MPPADASAPELPARTGTVPPEGAPEKLESGDYTQIRVFFGTDRARTGSPGPRKVFGAGRNEADALTLGYCLMTVPKMHQPGNVERPFTFLTLQLPEDRKHHITIEELKVIPDESSFYAGVKEELSRPEAVQDILVFVHGFNVSFDDAAYRTAQIAYDLGFKGVPVLYSWPSQGEVHEYTYDEANVEWSSRHLRDFLQQLADKSGAKRIHLIAHSMGNRALTWAMESMANGGALGRSQPFSQVVFAAPDVDRDTMRQLLGTIKPLASRLTLYASSDDEALRASQAVHGHNRAGEAGQGLLVAQDLMDTVDASGVDLSLLGHSYYGDSDAVVIDLQQLFLQGLSPEARNLTKARQGNAVYWTLPAGLPPGMLAGAEWFYTAVCFAILLYVALLVTVLMKTPGSYSRVGTVKCAIAAIIAALLLILLAQLRMRYGPAHQGWVGSGAAVKIDRALVLVLAVVSLGLALLHLRLWHKARLVGAA
jgi:esterase/lipase superfamily enzyme